MEGNSADGHLFNSTREASADKEENEQDLDPLKVKCSQTPSFLLSTAEKDPEKVLSPEDGIKSSLACSRQRHSQIEKRRRNKMNTYIMELSTLIPKYSSLPKLDKITILKKTVQHVKSIQGSTNLYCKLNKPSFLTDDEMKYLIHAVTGEWNSDSFLFAISCNQGQFLHVSDSVNHVLGINQNDWLGLSIFDMLHHKDVSKVKEQLSFITHEPILRTKHSGRISTTDPGISSGSWRSFFCRLKSGGYRGDMSDDQSKIETEIRDLTAPRFLTIHCSGFIKQCKSSQESESSSANYDDTNQNYLIVSAHLVKPSPQTNMYKSSSTYHSRLETDGKFVHIDQRVTGILGYLPQELVGTSVYELYHYDDLQTMAKVHQSVLQSTKHVISPEYRLRMKNGNYITLQNDMFRFINPWNKVTDGIMCSSKVIYSKKSSTNCSSESEQSKSTKEAGHGKLPGAGNIGRLIAKEALENENISASKLQTSSLAERKNDLRASIDYFGFRVADAPDHRSSTPLGSKSESYSNSFQNFQYPTPQQSPEHGYFSSSSSTGDASPYPPLKNGLRHYPNNENFGLENGGILGSAPQQHFFNTGSTQYDPRSNNQTFQALSIEREDLNSSNSDSAMDMVMSLLEDDASASGQIDLGDFAWAL